MAGAFLEGGMGVVNVKHSFVNNFGIGGNNI